MLVKWCGNCGRTDESMCDKCKDNPFCHWKPDEESTDLMVEYIREMVDQCERLAQMAEESTELGHACLKLRRAYDGQNPTPVKAKTAYESVLEECADVLLCAIVMGYDRGDAIRQINKTVCEKLARWVERLEARDESTIGE